MTEDEFLGACIRCGLCVRDCPFDTLRLARLGEDVATGTPYFVARDVPCEMCDDIPCVQACPTGALDKQLTDINDARMGLAVMQQQIHTFGMQGAGDGRADAVRATGDQGRASSEFVCIM